MMLPAVSCINMDIEKGDCLGTKQATVPSKQRVHSWASINACCRDEWVILSIQCSGEMKEDED